MLHIGENQIETLDLSHNQSIEYDGVGVVGEIARKRKTIDLRLSSCDLDEDCLDSLSHHLEDHRVCIVFIFVFVYSEELAY